MVHDREYYAGLARWYAFIADGCRQKKDWEGVTIYATLSQAAWDKARGKKVHRLEIQEKLEWT